jgi:hypothetical protein
LTEEADVARLITIRKLTQGLRRFRVAIPVLLVLAANFPALAQNASFRDRLPANTVFFAEWRGLSTVTSAATKNHVIQLFLDPQFTLGRDALLKSFKSSLSKKNTGNTDPEIADVLSILDNSAVSGFVLNPDSGKKTSSDAAVPPVGFFVIYDATGKTALVEKLRAANHASGKEAPTVMTYDFKGTTIEARTTGTDVSYTAHTSKYYFLADQKSVIEDLIVRFSSPEKPALSVTQLPEYQSIRQYVSPDAAIEFFARVPDLAKTLSPEQLAKPGTKFAENLHLDRIHVFGGSVSFAGEATRVRGAMLGDAAPGTIFDIAGASGSSFVTLPVVSPGPIFSVSRFDFAAIYRLIRAAALPTLTPAQAANIDTYEKMAQAFLGMPIPDALQLFTGEVASETSFADDGASLKTYAISIQKPQDVLRILRAVGSTIIVAEDTSAGTTFLDLAFPYTDPATGQKRRELYYVAVTPDMLFAAPRKAAVRQIMARLNDKAAANQASGVLANPEFPQMRSLLPEKLSGLSASDMTQIPYDKIIARIAQQVADEAKASGSTNPPATDWLQSVKPEVITRHIHLAVTGWWKDSSGIYFDSYVQ